MLRLRRLIFREVSRNQRRDGVRQGEVHRAKRRGCGGGDRRRLSDEHRGLSAAARQQAPGAAFGPGAGRDVRDRMGSLGEIALPHSKRSEAFAASMLMLACLGWAGFFSLTKNWQIAAEDCPGGSLVSSLTLLGIRPLLALFVFALVRPQLFLEATRREWLLGGILGLLNFLGNVPQVWGLSFTTPAVSGFFT